MLNIIIVGINGRMGRTLYDLAGKKGINVVCGVDKSISGEFNCPVFRDFDEVKEYADVIVDFSSPDTIFALGEYATQTNCKLVLCATGYTDDENGYIRRISEKTAVFKSANTSYGVAVLDRLCSVAAELLVGYDANITEIHHSEKKDSPSGTAKELYKTISAAGGANIRPESIYSLRCGNVTGEHKVGFYGQNEAVILSHTAYSKELFADGAIKCAEFIVDKPAGLYTIDDLISDKMKSRIYKGSSH